MKEVYENKKNLYLQAPTYSKISAYLDELTKEQRIKVALYCIEDFAVDSDKYNETISIIKKWLKNKKTITKTDLVNQINILKKIQENKRVTRAVINTLKCIIYNTSHRLINVIYGSSWWKERPLQKIEEYLTYVQTFFYIDDEWNLEHGFDLSNPEEVKIFLLDFMGDNNYYHKLYNENFELISDLIYIKGENPEDLAIKISESKLARGFLKNVYQNSISI